MMKISGDRLLQENLRVWDHYRCPLSTVEASRFLELSDAENAGTLLDIGCADGSLSAKMLDKGWMAYGIDISFSNAQAATRNGVKTLISYLQHPLPFKDNSFEMIFIKEVIEHLVDTRILLDEVFRILKPGGNLIISTPNLASLSNRIRLLFGLYPGWMDYELGSGAGHVRYYTRSTLRCQLVSVGFQVKEEIGTEIAFPVVGRFQPENKIKCLGWLGRKLPGLSPILICKVQKPGH